MSYEYVNWQPGDEVTSAKLKQMADNEQWIHDNIVSGDITYRAGADGSLPQGRTVGSQVAKDIYGIYLPFNSGVAASFYDVTIAYPPIFTTPPIINVTIANAQGANLCGILTFNTTTTAARYRVFRRDGAAVVLSGYLNVILLGT